MKNPDTINWEISVGVTFASFMSAVTLFFAGAVISQYKNFDDSIKIPLLFLIISTFSFIFAASIYSNAGLEVTANRPGRIKRYLIYANNILEFLGLYLFIIATPMVISALTKDDFLRVTTITVALVGLFFYSQSEFSILEHETRSHSVKIAIATIITMLAMCLYFAQYIGIGNQHFFYNFVATVLLLFIVGMTTYFCQRSQQYRS